MGEQMNIPQLRFPEFKDKWNEEKMGELYSFKVTNSFSRDNLNYEEGAVKNIHYGDIHTKFQTLFDITKETVPFINSDISIDRISEDNYCQEGDLILADASEDLNDVGKSIEIFNINNEKLLAGLHTILARPNLKKLDFGFGGYLFKSNKVRTKIQKEAQGSKVLSISATRLTNISLDFPSKDEQKKIVECFSSIDEKIQALKKKHSLLEHYKKGVMQKLFSQELRFKDEDGNEFPEWSPKKIGDSLDYEQPTNYLVSSTEYSDKHSTPVVTAGKTFILGYTDETTGIFSNDLPVIIFDDFTTASQFVDFPFKAKSSAMKILKAKENTDIKFMYEALQMVNYETGAHGRHWISVFAEMEILTPDYKEQIKISSFLSAIDKKINSVNTLLLQTENWKKGLLQKMFC
jgi:type I restriction enzyme, S subunit